MAVVNQLNLNVGTEQNPNFVLHDINDKRISTTAVTTATHLLTCNSGVTSIAPITAANLAAVLGVDKTISVYANANAKSVNVNYSMDGGYSITLLMTYIRYSDSVANSINTQVFLVTLAKGGASVKRINGNTEDYIRFYWKDGVLRTKSPVTGNTQIRVLSIPHALNSLSLTSETDVSISGYTAVTIDS